MLVLKQNTLTSDDLITCESTMLKFIDDKLSRTGMDFKVFDWSIPELYGIVLGMMVKLDLEGTLNITNSEMLDLIIDVDNGYLETSYHSFYHAVDVVAVLYYILTELDAAKYLTPLDCICLLIAGLCHDIGHPGLNNNYQVNAKTELSRQYNGQSVLENYSCTLTMDIISKHKLFRNVHKVNAEYMGMYPEEVDQSLKSLIEKIILATDMSFHFELLESLSNMIESTWSPCSSENSGDEMDSIPSTPSPSPPSSPDSCSPPISVQRMFESSDNRNRISQRSLTVLEPDQRELWLKVLIHAADLSNAVRPWEISKVWSDLVVEEFFHQGDLEKRNRLPVSPNMDREQSHQSQISLGFGDFVVKPYFEVFATFLQPAAIFSKILARNRVSWDELDKALKPAEVPAPPTSPVNNNTTHKPSGRRVSLAPGLLIIPDDIEKLHILMAPKSPRHRNRKLKRSLSGRSYSHHSLLSPSHVLAGDDDDDLEDESCRKPTRRKSGPNPTTLGKVAAMLASNSPPPFTNVKKKSHLPAMTPPPPHKERSLNNCRHDTNSINRDNSVIDDQRRCGRVRRSSSLDHNMIREITAIYGTGGQNFVAEQLVIAGS